MRVLSEEGRGEADRNVADCSSADTSAKRNDTHMSEGKGKKERHCIRLRRDCCCSSTSEGGLNTYLSLLSTCTPARTMTGVVSKIGAARVEVSSKEKRRRERCVCVCVYVSVNRDMTSVRDRQRARTAVSQAVAER